MLARAARKLSTAAASPCSTIFASASGHGKCGVTVIRVSGPSAHLAVHKVGRFESLPAPRQATLKRLVHPVTSEILDQGLVLWFPAPASFTGEDCCEFHVHGGAAVVTAVLGALGQLGENFRHAEPGEFTKRAFLNGKLDLTEVEGLADLIHAETEAQRRQALRQLQGDLSTLYSSWRQQLLKSSADVEAYIDFSEDENIEDGILDQVQQRVSGLYSAICQHLDDGRRGERLRDGVRVAIVGEPNVGKSSLLNALCQRPAAIVSPIAGTTRDVIETALNFSGYPVVVCDTAGLRECADAVEQEGVRRALQRAAEADVRLLVVDAAEHLPKLQTILNVRDSNHRKSALGDFVADLEASLGLVAAVDAPDGRQEVDRVIVLNKIDLLAAAKSREEPDVAVQSSICDELSSSAPEACFVCFTSCQTGQGLNQLVDSLCTKVKRICGNPLAGNPSLTQARHRDHMTRCTTALKRYLQRQDADIVLAAQDLRIALHQLGKVTGKVTSEEILDVIFKDFCIGK